jgi:1-aminocyclopropane-1-carboxylate deaminase/D-cysteine desulfhydrase-like pyridoxal-dependent ACC family enzyme
VSGGLRAALRERPLASLPTPLEPAPRLGARLGVELWVKREDRSGLGLGGNKARQVEVLLADALERGAEVVLTTASAQSNFCRVFAAGAARLGLRCVLLLRGDGRAAPAGNLLLDLLFGAEVHWIEIGDPYDPAVLERLQALAAGAGGRARIVQLPGEAGPLAAAAAASLAVEIAEQCEPEAIWLAAGSGLTAAGLALGCEALGLPARVLAARLEGWVLDPVYTGKALAGLIAGAEAGERVVFVHSGGAPALFAHGAAVAAHLLEPA